MSPSPVTATPAPARARFRPAFALIPFTLVLALAYCGIDFGYHWDEDHNKVNAVAYSLDHDFTLLPDGYNYPGVNYWLTLGALAPEMWQTVRVAGADAPAFKAALTPVLHSRDFHLRLRRIYAFGAALTGVWIYLAIQAWGGMWLEALAGSLLFAGSWEVVYHARWVAPDPILMQFGALGLLLLILAWKHHSLRAAGGAAIVAGLACGTKYPGALLLLPVLVLPLLPAADGNHGGRRTMRLCLFGLLFTATYLLTTPGTILQPFAFYRSLLFSQQVYAHGWYGYTVTPGLSHLGKIIYYFANSIFSASPPVAWIGFGFMLLGACALLWENGRAALGVLLFPVVYALYFSLQTTMVVRNYLILVPFAVFLAARGLAWAHHKVPSHGLRLIFLGLITAMLGANLFNQVQAAMSVARGRDTAHFVAQFADYADRHPDRRMLVSTRLSDALRQQDRWPRANLRLAPPNAPGQFDEYASFYSETVIPRELDWPTNRPHSFTAVFGPRDVNLDYYTGWKGNERVICLSPAMASATGVLRP